MRACIVEEKSRSNEWCFSVNYYHQILLKIYIIQSSDAIMPWHSTFYESREISGVRLLSPPTTRLDYECKSVRFFIYFSWNIKQNYDFEYSYTSFWMVFFFSCKEPYFMAKFPFLPFCSAFLWWWNAVIQWNNKAIRIQKRNLVSSFIILLKRQRHERRIECEWEPCSHIVQIPFAFVFKCRIRLTIIVVICYCAMGFPKTNLMWLFLMYIFASKPTSRTMTTTTATTTALLWLNKLT